MSSMNARATRGTFQPRVRVTSEKPYPGSDGTTTWKASSARPPCASGAVSRGITSRNSTTEPGQPCVSSNGNASGCSERAWMKWIDCPSMSVRKCSSSLSRASCARQS